MKQINFNNENLYGYPIEFKADEIGVQKLNQKPQMQQNVLLPDLYYMPEHYTKKKGFKETLKQYDLLGLVYQWFAHPFMMLGTCLGITLGIDAFNRSCSKEYEKSILGKAAKFGDKIENSKIIQNKNSQKVLSGIGKGWRQIKKFFGKSAVVRSMFETPSSPEWKMPKYEMEKFDHRIVSRFKEILTEINVITGKDGKGNAKYKKHKYNDLALDKNEISELKKLYNVKNLSKAPQEELYNRVMLKRLGKTDSEITSVLAKSNQTEEVVKILRNKAGLTPEEWAILECEKTTDEAVKIAKKAAKNLESVKISKGKLKIPGTYQPFADLTSCKEISNRFMSIGDGAKTKTGKLMGKILQMMHRGFTFGGTKFGVMLFVAPMLVEAMLRTKKAEPKQKVGTAVGGALDTITWVFTFPLILRAIHAYGGIQYAGMGKDKVEQFKKLINDFNEKVDKNEFKDSNSYKIAKKELKKQLKDLKTVKNQSLLTTVLRKISHFTKADLLKIKSFNGGSAASNLLRKLPSKLKDYVVYSPARFLIFMFVGMPFADKLIKKVIEAIFGKEYDEMKEEEHKGNKEKQEAYTMDDLRNRMLDVQKKKINNEPLPQMGLYGLKAVKEELHNSVRSTNDNTLLNKVANMDMDNKNLNNPIQTEIKEEVEIKENTQNEQPSLNTLNTLNTASIDTNKQKIDNYTYIPSSENIFNKTNSSSDIDKQGKYIPAQTPAKFAKTYDNSNLESALQRADRAEKRAINILAGNFNE